MERLLAALQARVRARIALIVRRMALGGVGGVLMLLGAGFLLAAFWTVLARVWDPLVASLGMGLVFTGLGLIAIGLAGRTPRDPEAAADARARAESARAKRASTAGAESAADGPDDPALRRILRDAGLDVPPRGESPALTEAFLFGLILAMRMTARPAPQPPREGDPPPRASDPVI